MIGSPASGSSSMAEVFWNADNPDHRRAFATAIAPLVVLWKRKDPMMPPAEAKVYMRALKHVPSAILVAAVERTLEQESWFPEPAKLVNHAADLIEEGRQRAWQKHLGGCEDCHGSRWVSLEVDGVERLERCGCFKRAMVAMSEVGQPIKRPLALPSAPDQENRS